MAARRSFRASACASAAADGEWSLGRTGWSGRDGETAPAADTAGSELRKNGEVRATFRFHESLRPDAIAMLRRLERSGLALHILSGDHPDKVRHMAETLSLPANQAHVGGLSPEEKAAGCANSTTRTPSTSATAPTTRLHSTRRLVTGTPVVDRSLLESKADFYTLGAGLGFLPGLLGHRGGPLAGGPTRVFVRARLQCHHRGLFDGGKMSPLLAAILMPMSSIVSITIVAAVSRTKFPNKG
jgi:P-type Cu2+ transporter